ncbi:MAG: hypothetical protein JWN56_2295 [Sphingobacteriales bacterium]|nr:hypothetical protein [Sphingobacteriales bacterium]
MINQFRHLNPLNILLLVGIAVLLRLGFLINIPDELSFDFIEPFAKLLISIPLENAFNPQTNIFIAFWLVIVQAFILNRIVNKYNLIGKPTFLPALLYVTTSCLLKSFLILSPTLICNLLTIWMIDRFLSIYKSDEVKSVMFDIGMIIGCGSLIYFPYIAMLPLLWICLIIFRPFDWREWISGIFGFIIIFFFLWVFYFWNDATGKFFQIWLPLTTKFPTNLDINYYDYLVLIPVIIILTLGVFHLRNNFFKSYVQVRKTFQVLLFMFLLVMISFYLKHDFMIYHFLLGVPSASILMSYYFLHASKRWFYESLYLMLVGFIIYFQIF